MSSQGARIKQIRQALNLSQERFGESLDVSKQYISNLEANRNLLNNEKLVKLLNDFNINLNFLIGGIGEMFIKTQPKIEGEYKAELRRQVMEFLKEEGVIDK